jgi:hypothetical protein
MSVLRSDYDDDPGRWRSWRAARDVHHEIAPRLFEPVLDLGCEYRHHGIAADRAERVPAPLRLTERGMLVSATRARR